jgi:hypothetical protein
VAQTWDPYEGSGRCLYPKQLARWRQIAEDPNLRGLRVHSLSYYARGRPIQAPWQKPAYKYYPVIPDIKQVQTYLDEAYVNGWPVKLPVNGYAAID